ncbi:PAS domain S-box protein [Spirosoma soli]|uniref:histidine kinase n=1 Tax=Spirosoma soli TaxID=1770529 RepID=A0ABW5LZT1_9BACT
MDSNCSQHQSTPSNLSQPGAWEAHDLWTMISESIKDFAIFTTDLERRVTSWNAGAQAILGYTEEQIINQLADSIFTPEDRLAGAPGQEQQKALNEGKAEDERWHLRQDGSRFWASGMVRPLKDKNGTNIGLVKVMRDLTTQKQTEDSLLQSQKQTVDILESTTDAFYALDEDFRFTYVNQRAARLWGRDRDSLIGRHYWTEFPDAVGSESYHKHYQAVKEGKPIHYETISLLLEAWIDVLIYPGSQGGLSVFFRDVTQRKQAEEVLRLSEQRLQQVLSIQTVGVIYFSLGGDITDANEAFQRMSGYAKDDFVRGRVRWDELTPPEFMPVTQIAQQEYRTRGENTPYQKQYIRPDGSRWWGLFAGKRLYEDEYVEFVLDITPEKEAEQALLLSQQRFDLLSKATQDAIWDWNLLTDEIWWNEGFNELFGYQNQAIEPTSISWSGRVHPDDVERVVGGIHQVIDQGGKHWSAEYRFRRQDGSYAIVHDRSYTLYDQSGKPYRMLGSMQDITRRKESEVTLIQSEERFRTLASSIDQLAWIAGADGWIHWYNDRWYAYTGTTIEQMQGWGWQAVHHPEHLDRVVEFVQEAWRGNQPWELTFPLRDRHGQYRWFLTRVYPVKDHAGRVLQWVGTNTDIDAHKQAEELLEQKVRERTGALEAKTRELEEFTYVSHHDLKEPIRKIQIFSQLIRSESGEQLSDTSRHHLERVIQSANRMNEALRDVLRYASLSQPEHFEVVDLNQVLRAVLDDLELVIGETKAQLEVSSLPTLEASAYQMHQLFYNLLANALKFTATDQPPHIRITCQQVRGNEILSEPLTNRLFYQIAVSDQGIGFDPHQADKLFGMFQRLHGKSQYEGTGVGLALVRKVVLNHGGRVWAEGMPGQGATFYVRIPASQYR